MSKLKMSYHCYGCGSSGEVDDITDICGACPDCMSHHGEVEYSCDMTVADFLNALYEMTEKEMVKNLTAIRECAYDLAQNL